jgi:hypothetical protein
MTHTRDSVRTGLLHDLTDDEADRLAEVLNAKEKRR